MNLPHIRFLLEILEDPYKSLSSLSATRLNLFTELSLFKLAEVQDGPRSFLRVTAKGKEVLNETLNAFNLSSKSI